ncbi:uncharacterized protein LOC144909370 [Branchiostoma floridae x Branchiostoma belcheri]
MTKPVCYVAIKTWRDTVDCNYADKIDDFCAACHTCGLTILPWTAEIIIAMKSSLLVAPAASAQVERPANTSAEAFWLQDWLCATTHFVSSVTRLLTGSWSAHTWAVTTHLSTSSKTNTRTTPTSAASMPSRHGVTPLIPAMMTNTTSSGRHCTILDITIATALPV